MMPLLLRERLLALSGTAGVFLLLLGGAAFHSSAPREVAQTSEVQKRDTETRRGGDAETFQNGIDTPPEIEPRHEETRRRGEGETRRHALDRGLNPPPIGSHQIVDFDGGLRPLGLSAPDVPVETHHAPRPRVPSSPRHLVNPSASLSTSPLDTRKTVLVDRSARTVTVLQDGNSLATFQADIGGAGTPTPTGTFTVNAMKIAPAWKNPRTGEIVPPGAGNPIGSRWIGFADIARGSVGFHEATDGGTGRAASQGCVRLRRQDLEALYAHVREGMPVIVQE